MEICNNCGSLLKKEYVDYYGVSKDIILPLYYCPYCNVEDSIYDILEKEKISEEELILMCLHDIVSEEDECFVQRLAIDAVNAILLEFGYDLPQERVEEAYYAMKSHLRNYG